MKLRLFFASILFALFSTVAQADEKPPAKNDPPAQTDAEKLAAALARQRELEEENARLKRGKKKSSSEDDEDDEDDDDEDDEDDEDGDDLRSKARKARKKEERNQATTKDIERALSFNLSIDDFIVKNASLLPSEITSIVKLAHKETYDSALAKACALKASIIQSYFAVQENVDALTTGQKATLDDYLKLTKTGKESKAADVYENIFEPALETIRKVKKAEELGRGRAGYSAPNDQRSAYKDRLVAQAKKTHLGEKST